MTWDVVIVGGGPAGLSAALVLGRARRSVLVIDDGQPRNAAARQVGGYLGLEGLGPLEFLERGRAQVRTYGVEVMNGRVVSACEAEDGRGFEVTATDGSVHRGRKLLLCTGVRDDVPGIEGFRSLYGRGVHHCPYCDGWDHRDGRLAAFGPPEHAVPLALSLLTWSSDVTVLTDGTPIPEDLAERVRANGLQVDDRPVVRLEGDGDDATLRRAVLDGEGSVELDALFFHTRRTQHSGLPELLGCRLDRHDEVVVGEGQGTGVDGLFLAGDASGDVQFVVVAAAEGARAAMHINREMQAEERA